MVPLTIDYDFKIVCSAGQTGTSIVVLYGVVGVSVDANLVEQDVAAGVAVCTSGCKSCTTNPHRSIVVLEINPPAINGRVVYTSGCSVV